MAEIYEITDLLEKDTMHKMSKTSSRITIPLQLMNLGQHAWYDSYFALDYLWNERLSYFQPLDSILLTETVLKT